MRYLIDGYNLAHKITLPAGKVGPARLDAARSELLALIAAGHGDAVNTVTVVFDTKRSRNIEAEQVIRGIDVRFAIGEEADDMIERLAHAHTSPKQLTVVSDDHRVQAAGRRRGSRILSCQEYLDELDGMSRAMLHREPQPEKPATTSPSDAAEWLAAFQEPVKPLTKRFNK